MLHRGALITLLLAYIAIVVVARGGNDAIGFRSLRPSEKTVVTVRVGRPVKDISLGYPRDVAEAEPMGVNATATHASPPQSRRGKSKGAASPRPQRRPAGVR
jgi:hypothetical protein